MRGFLAKNPTKSEKNPKNRQKITVDRGRKEGRKEIKLECFCLYYLGGLTAFIPEFRRNLARTHRNLETSLKLPKKKKDLVERA